VNSIHLSKDKAQWLVSIHLSKDKAQWLASVNTVMKFRIP